MVNICDINHFEDIDKYLSSISQILDTTPESIEYKHNKIIATKKYVISHLESRVCHLRKYSMQIEYRIDGIVKVKCETILGEVLNTSIPYVIEEVIYE